MKLNTIFLGIIATALAGPYVVAFGTSSIESFKEFQITRQCTESFRQEQLAKARADYDIGMKRVWNPTTKRYIQAWDGGPELETEEHCINRIRYSR